MKTNAGAARAGIRNNSNIESSKHSKMSFRSSSLLSRIKSWLAWQKIRIWMIQHENETRRIINKHCRNGFHKINVSKRSWIWWENKEKYELKVQYLSCQYCGYTHFPNVNEKRKYVAMQNHDRELARRLFEKWPE